MASGPLWLIASLLGLILATMWFGRRAVLITSGWLAFAIASLAYWLALAAAGVTIFARAGIGWVGVVPLGILPAVVGVAFVSFFSISNFVGTRQQGRPRSEARDNSLLLLVSAQLWHAGVVAVLALLVLTVRSFFGAAVAQATWMNEIAAGLVVAFGVTRLQWTISEYRSHQEDWGPWQGARRALERHAIDSSLLVDSEGLAAGAREIRGVTGRHMVEIAETLDQPTSISRVLAFLKDREQEHEDRR